MSRDRGRPKHLLTWDEVPHNVVLAMEQVRAAGRVNMFEHTGVARLMIEAGYPSEGRWVARLQRENYIVVLEALGAWQTNPMNPHARK